MTSEPTMQLSTEEPSTLGNFVIAIARTIEELGFDPVTIFRAAGLGTTEAEYMHSRVAISQLAIIWQKGVEVTSNDALGIEVAQRIRPITLDALSMSLFASETLMSALYRFARYHTMISDALEMEIEADELSVRLILKNFYPHRAKEGIDCALASPLHFCREISREDIVPEMVCFTRPPPKCLDRFENFFHCPMTFNSGANSITLSRGLLERALPGSNKEISDHLEGLVEKYVTSRKRTGTLNQAYKIIIKYLPSSKISEKLLAEHFNCSTRQLQRKLKDEGTSFRELLDKIRTDLAKHYIKVNQFSIAETAYLLGYSDPNNFSRAFKKWTGVTPGEYRKSD